MGEKKYVRWIEKNVRVKGKLKNQTRAPRATKARKKTKRQEPPQSSDSKVW